jgi:hypothetical protein
MSEKADGNVDGAGAGGMETGTEVERLANALRHEKAKTEVLLGEVIALEDELVNRSMADYDAVVSDDTREFWREQLLTNRAKATVALTELARAKQIPASGVPAGATGSTVAGASVAGGAGTARRPLHNRAVARAVAPAAVGGGGTATGAEQAGAGVADDRAAKIRNRAQEISKADRVTFAAAFRRAELEVGGQ